MSKEQIAKAFEEIVGQRDNARHDRELSWLAQKKLRAQLAEAQKAIKSHRERLMPGYSGPDDCCSCHIVSPCEYCLEAPGRELSIRDEQLIMKLEAQLAEQDTPATARFRLVADAASTQALISIAKSLEKIAERPQVSIKPAPVLCKRCHGEGKMWKQPVDLGTYTCPVCRGSGRL